MQAIARLFSTLLSPLLMPTYGIFLVLWVSILCYLPTGTRMVVLLVVFGITCILPMTVIAVLHNLKVIEDKRLVNRKERLLPYIAAFLCYVTPAEHLALPNVEDVRHLKAYKFDALPEDDILTLYLKAAAQGIHDYNMTGGFNFGNN